MHIFIFNYSAHTKVPLQHNTHTPDSTNVVCLESSRYVLFITVDGGGSSSNIIVSHYCQMQKDLKRPKCFIKGCRRWGKKIRRDDGKDRPQRLVAAK